MILITLAVGVAATIRQTHIARQQAEAAKAERARAERRFNDVRDLANSLIFEIHDSIQSLPGATPSRRLLLDRAVQYLDKLSQDANGDVNLERELAWAYHRLATVQGDTTQSNLGQVGAAEVSNKKAMALFEAVARANPSNLTDQLNLAMAYRWRAFFDIYEKTGRAEIERALAVTEPLMRTNADNIDLQNERALEYGILADIQDAAGDRLQAIDSYRNVRDLRQQIVARNPAYPGARQGLAKISVMLAHEMGRFGARNEGLKLMTAAIADFEKLLKESDGNPGLVREVSAAEGRRGDIELIQGDISAARKDFSTSQQRIERLARLDPENKMLQSDLWVVQFQDGKALALAGRYAEALPRLEGAFRGYQALHLEADVGPGPPAMQAWIGEAQAGLRNFSGALKNYEAASAGLAADEANFDDARCDLAVIEAKIGGVLLKLGKTSEAKAHFDRALEVAKPDWSIAHSDFPALYAAADAYVGLGDVVTAQGRAAKTIAPSTWQKDACDAYEKGVAVWRHMPTQSRLSGNGYLAIELAEISRRLLNCAGSGPTHP